MCESTGAAFITGQHVDFIAKIAHVRWGKQVGSPYFQLQKFFYKSILVHNDSLQLRYFALEIIEKIVYCTIVRLLYGDGPHLIV